ncbi:hypothetical protein [Desulfobotulus mexicanus]|uniref:Uncharacterized protein n=1 Tax=Desulfobotulus mexicanus TaxID=2586642 RepID=A0A5S5MF17_9BACT|nr:hypothetical protein [Desulfobotulus mexicanus]TYT74294.1 hypothetical protein FIM25_11030 [Desulfobotulus mexicanus]
MGKTLVGIKNLEEHICKDSCKIYIDGSIILTPGAKDELRSRGITIVYGPKPEAAAACPPGCTCEVCSAKAKGGCPAGCTCPACMEAALRSGAAGLESLILGIAGMLKTQYGISDPAQLMAISSKVVKTIRDNLQD